VILIALFASALTLIAVPLKPAGDISIPLFNRPTSLVALWIIALLQDRLNGERKLMERSLRIANNKLGIMNDITRHDVTNQIMVVNGYLELCKQREKDAALSMYFDKMSQATDNVQKQIGFAKMYQGIGKSAPIWTSISQPTSKAFEMPNPPGIKLEEATNGLEILADPLFEKVPYNLIDNSMRHGGHVTRIKISSKRVDGSIVITYEDDGVGISTEERSHMFEKGHGKNNGFGLFLLREILSMTDITIQEDGELGKGVRFEITVPAGAWRSPRID
jgi:K+-sensing histidine kinase KdpD